MNMQMLDLATAGKCSRLEVECLTGGSTQALNEAFQIKYQSYQSIIRNSLYLFMKNRIVTPMLRLNLPPLNALKAFDAAARLGGFRKASDALNVTHGVVGRHIRSLEERLGVVLFKKANRGVVLTEAGRSYHAKISKALEAISHATEELQHSHIQEPVRISVVSGFGAKWLSRRLHRLSADLSGVKIVLLPAGEQSKENQEKVDFSIVFGAKEEFTGTRQLIARTEYFPVCSPTYLAEMGPLDDPEALLRVERLNEDFGDWWTRWFNAHGIKYTSSDNLVFSTASQVVDAAIADQGVALVNRFLVEDDLSSGRLIKINIPTNFDSGAYWIVHDDRAPLRSSAARVSDWILSETQIFKKGNALD